MSFNSKDSKRNFFTKNEECMKDNDTHIAAADKKKKRKCGSNERNVMQERTMRSRKEEIEGSSRSKHSRDKKQQLSLSCKKT